MDFFASQETARRKTGRLVIYFTLAVLLIIGVIYALIAFFFLTGSGRMLCWDPTVFSGVALVTSLVLLLGSLFKIIQLRQGGEHIALLLGGRRIPPNTTDFHEKRLLNVVEEMALAAGVPVPPVFAMDREPGINAFAAGYQPEDAVIGSTRGTIQHLNRDELQGVIAHEFSHILTGDMRLNIRLMGVLHGILLISLIGNIILRSGARSSGGKRGNILPLIGLALMIIGHVGVFFGHLIKSAVSRQREYLADASAVQFTRNPGGISGALKKIGGLAQGGRIRHPQAEQASHMFFGNALRASWLALLSTHPPLADRVRRIDSSFDGSFPAVAPPAQAAAPPPGPAVSRGMPASFFGAPASPSVVLQSIGRTDPARVAGARSLMDEIPDALTESARDAAGACRLMYLLLLDRNEALRKKQLLELRRRLPEQDLDLLSALDRNAPPIAPHWRLPLVDLAMPALRALSPPAYEEFRAALDQLMAADEAINLFEYMLRSILLRRLEATFAEPRFREPPLTSLMRVSREAGIVLSQVARIGSEGEAQTRASFARGLEQLRGMQEAIQLLPEEACSLHAVDEALQRLALLRPLLKRQVVEACLECLFHDHTVTVEEAELFRAIADALDCPVPPWFAATAKNAVA